MSNNPLQTKPLDNLEQSQLGLTELFGWTVTVSPDGLGLVIEAPEGKHLSMVDGRFVVSNGGKRLEVRAK